MIMFDESFHNELFQLTRELCKYYDIDKTKDNSVYVWTKCDFPDTENVFDITENGLKIYNDNHQIPDEAMIIINRIQEILKNIRKSKENTK